MRETAVYEVSFDPLFVKDLRLTIKQNFISDSTIDLQK